MSFDPNDVTPPGAKIKVIGVGGGGGNAVNTMIRSSLENVDFIAANTDVQALRFSLAQHKVQIGKELTRGLGAGADPDIGRDAALEDRKEIEHLLAGADMVFITAGMGGGTGTGGAAVIAQIARELGALTVAVVTKPFTFEGKRRRRHAELGIDRLRDSVDTLITIPNQRLLQVANPGLSMIDAFKMADDVLVNAVRGINDIINIPGILNVDFADVKTIMSNMGQALMGIGAALGPTRAVDAARMAISSPLLEDIDIEGATGILINITAGADLAIAEIGDACAIVQEAAHEDANIIFGAVIDESLGGQMQITVIATGFPVEKDDAPSHGGDSKKSSVVTAPNLMQRPRPAATSSVQASGTAAQPTITKEPPLSAEKSEPTAMPVKSPEPNAAVSLPLASATAISANEASTRFEAQELTRWTLNASQENSERNQVSDVVPEDLALDSPATLLTSDQQSVVGEPLNLSDLSLAPIPALNAEQPSSDHLEGALEHTHVHGATGLATMGTLEAPMTLSHHGLDLPRMAASAATPSDQADDLDDLLGFAPINDAHAASDVPSLSRAGAVTEREVIDPEPGLSPIDASAMVSDIDRKIDEALALADRMRPEPTGLGLGGLQAGTDHDDLDVPAFLRQSMKDLPLG